MQWPDAFGIGLFTATGTQIELGAEMPTIGAVPMGMVTAAFFATSSATRFHGPSATTSRTRSVPSPARGWSSGRKRSTRRVG